MFRKRYGPRQPVDQGSLRELSRLVVEPFVRNCKPPTMGLAAWLEAVWSTAERKIEVFQATKEFSHPGLKKVLGGLHFKGLASTHPVPKGSMVIVRTDSDWREKDFVEIEVYKGSGKAEQVYRMTDLEFNRYVKPNIVPFVSTRKKYRGGE